jgi:hypothetical protein
VSPDPTATRGEALPPFVKRVEAPRLARRALSALVLRAVDAGWTRRTPLDTHVVICGFPRAGSTLLALILQASYPAAKGYPRERTVLRVAYATERNHRLLISKRPDDVFYMDEGRRIYAGRRPRLRFLLTMRDPRAVLTSVHAGTSGGYYVSPERWRATYARFARNRQHSDVLIVRFEDLLERVGRIQEAVTGFLGQAPERPFERFLDHVPANFKQTALNGLRALDPAAAAKWRAAKHRDRLAAMLDAIPELPQVLIDEGYETDTAWTRDYTSGPGRVAGHGVGA